MTVAEYARLVAEMREAQRRFFCGDRSVLAAAKRLEKKVDLATASMMDPDPRRQSSMFELD